MQIKSCLPFSNSNPQFKPTDIIMSVIARNRMKNWEVIADNLSKAGWSWGCVSTVDSRGHESLLLTHTAIMESVSLCGRMKS